MSAGLTTRPLSHRVDDSTARLSARLQSRIAARRAVAGAEPDAGMTTAEYAVGTVAACGFSGILIELVKSDALRKLIKDMVVNTIKHFFSF